MSPARNSPRTSIKSPSPAPLMEVLGAVTVGVLLLFARARIQAGVLTPEMMSVFVVALITLL